MWFFLFHGQMRRSACTSWLGIMLMLRPFFTMECCFCLFLTARLGSLLSQLSSQASPTPLIALLYFALASWKPKHLRMALGTSGFCQQYCLVSIMPSRQALPCYHPMCNIATPTSVTTTHFISPSVTSEAHAFKCKLVPFCQWLNLTHMDTCIHGLFVFTTANGHKAQDCIS